MIRIAGIAALGLPLNTCPFGKAEEPDGYAQLIGSVLTRDGSPFSGQGHALCWTTPYPEPLFFKVFRVDDGVYSTVLEAPFGSRVQPGEPNEFLCRVQASLDRDLVARRFVTVRFSPARGDRPTTRVDLRADEIEQDPEREQP